MSIKSYIDLTALDRFLTDLLVSEIIEVTEGQKVANITETKRAPSVKAVYDYVQSEIGDVVDAMTIALNAKLSEVKYDSTNKKITSKNGTTKDVVTVDTIRSDMDTFGASGENHKKGLVPDPGSTAGTTKYLREDGTWHEPDSPLPLEVVNGKLNIIFTVEAYDPSESYVVGDHCYVVESSENVVKVCIEDTTGTYDPACWMSA